MIKPATIKAYQLLHDGMIALSQIESNGIRVDENYLKRKIEKTAVKIAYLIDNLKQDDIYTTWRKTYAQQTNIGSREQLGNVLFNKLKYKSDSLTATGRHKTDQKALETLNLPFVKDFLKIEKLKKANSTYLKGIQREIVDGFLHPFYNLHLAQTYRSCVAKGTLIEVVRDISKHPKGVLIEDVKAGDYVYCYDKKCNLTIKKVLWSGKTGCRKVIRLHWSARGKKGHVDVTPEHKIRLVHGNYVKAGCLQNKDFRKEHTSKHSPKIQVLAMGRCDDRLFQTNGVKELLDHRFIYEKLIGPLDKKDVIHHKDGNHLNNKPNNLCKMTLSKHSFIHHTFTEKGRIEGRKQRIKNHKKYGDRWNKGKQCYNYININKYSFLRILAKAGGYLTKTPHDFGVMKNKALSLDINLKRVKNRYDKNRKYISIGRLKTLHKIGIEETRKELGINYYKVKQLFKERGLSVERKWGNQFGPFIPNNHKITKIEYINKIVDVYDIEIEEHHNFIANEICVHNSSDSPNFQNIPIRNPEISKLVRRAFVSRDGYQLVEVDYGGAEIHGAAWYHKDPVMLEYLCNPKKDLHRDMAKQCYLLPKNELTKSTDKDDAKRIKNIRYCGKNMFVFPQFYGDYYIDCSRALWEAIGVMKLHTKDGRSLYKFLKTNGIKKLGICDPKQKPRKGTFEKHIQDVEHDFWNNRFKIYNQWRKEWYWSYQKRGWFNTLTGFHFEGYFKRNEVINYPVQGVAFHCLLWSLIRIQKLLKKYSMRTLIVGQIHDSIISDVYRKELQNYLEICRQVMVVDIKKHWKWIITPIDIEAEVSPLGGNWHEKEKVKI